MVIRVNKNKNYTVMSNVHLQDARLTLKAKGLLSVILSLPDDWHYTISGLTSLCSEKETAVKSALNELKQCGYIKVDKKKPNNENGGRWEYIYNIYENPQSDNQTKENQHQENLNTENQQQEILPLENLPLEILPVENLPVYKILKKQNTNIQNTNNTNYCAEPKKSATTQNDSEKLQTEEIAISIPLLGNEEYNISKTEVNQMEKYYPAIDVMDELRKCAAWNYANAKNRKTKRGIMRHINGWLSRAQDSARRYPMPNRNQSNNASIDFANLWYNEIEGEDKK